MFAFTIPAAALAAVYRARLGAARRRRHARYAAEARDRGVVVANPAKLRAKKEAFARAGGAGALRVVADFDYTLTRFWADAPANTVRAFSSHRTIEDSGLLSDAYHARVKAMQQKYYPLEVSTTLSHEEKLAHMIDWWNGAHETLVNDACGFRRAHIREAVRRARAQEPHARLLLRPGAAQFMNALHAAGVPLLVFSAGVADVLEEVVRASWPAGRTGNPIDRAGSRVTVASNRMRFGAGVAFAVEGMMCAANCGATVRRALAAVDGVARAWVDFPAARATVVLEEGADAAAAAAACVEAVEDVGFGCAVVDSETTDRLVGFSRPLYHLYSKRASAIAATARAGGREATRIAQGSPFFREAGARPCVLLVGDSLGDLRMADGADNAQEVLTVGFLNDRVEARLPSYAEAFDVVVVGDAGFGAVNELLAELLQVEWGVDPLIGGRGVL